jgi:hypothetical protein
VRRGSSVVARKIRDSLYQPHGAAWTPSRTQLLAEDSEPAVTPPYLAQRFVQGSISRLTVEQTHAIFLSGFIFSGFRKSTSLSRCAHQLNSSREMLHSGTAADNGPGVSGRSHSARQQAKKRGIRPYCLDRPICRSISC